MSERYGIQAGSINSDLFQDRNYKFGSFGNPHESVRTVFESLAFKYRLVIDSLEQLTGKRIDQVRIMV